MDMFDVFTGAQPNRKSAKSASGSRRGGFAERSGMVVRMRGASVLFFDDDSQQEIFVPLSQVKDWWFTASCSKQGLALEDCDLNDEVTLLIPKWLALKEGMV